jgi:phage terminase large subunit-like protein
LPDTKRAVRELAAWVQEHFPNLPHTIVVENAANGPDVVAQLRDNVQGLILNNAEGDKVSGRTRSRRRSRPATCSSPASRSLTAPARIPARTPAWVQELIAECAAFPNAANDDQVDSVSQEARRPRRSGRDQPGDRRP